MEQVSLNTTFIDGEGFVWDYTTGQNISDGNRDAFDGGIDWTNIGFGSQGVLSSDGRTLTTDTVTDFNGIIQQREIYVSPDSGFARFVDTVTNSTNSTQTYVYRQTTNLGPSTSTFTTSSGDSVIDTNDRWIATGPDNAFDDGVALVYGDGGGINPSIFQQVDSDDLVIEYTLTLAPGETASILTLAAQNVTEQESVFDAQNLSSLRPEFLVGLSEQQLSSIVNFDASDIVQFEFDGTSSDDFLVGDDFAETFNGFGGDDFISGEGDDDIINGNTGDDFLLGGDGNDIINAGNDNDTVDGGDDDDTINGGRGDDNLIGGNGNDTLIGGDGRDQIDGGDGNDLITGDDGSTLQTTANTVTIPSTGQQFSVSLTLPDRSEDETVPASGFVSRSAVTNDTFNIAFVIDVSGSTDNIFNGAVAVGDANNDGRANTILDAEILGIEALLEGISSQVGLSNINVSIIGFESDAFTAFSGNATIDSNGNGISDAVDALRGLNDLGSTNFEAGLQETVNFFNGSPDGQNLVFFLSDGANNAGGPFSDEVITLLDDNGIDATIRSFGVGTNSDPDEIDLLDDNLDNNSQVIVDDPSTLSQFLIDPGISQSDVDRVEILLNGNLITTIPGSLLETTPLGLRFDFDTVLSGLLENTNDVVEVRAIANDPANTVVSTTQVIEDAPTNGAADRLFGGDGSDLIFGGIGNDIIRGGNGGDFLLGELGNDIVTGGSGRDTLDGGSGNDNLNGGDDNDILFGRAGLDIIEGGRGSDEIDGGSGNDRITGGNGEDLIFGGNGIDIISGGSANDEISGGSGNDVIMGDNGRDVIDGNRGNDSILGGSGIDTIHGGASNDTISGENGNDMLFGGGQSDMLFGGKNDDVLDGGSGNDILSGGSDDDVLLGGSGSDTLNGNSGVDELRGGLGNDVLAGGSDAGDIFIFDAADAGSDRILDYQDGLDSFRFTGGIVQGDITVSDAGSSGQNARIDIAGAGITIIVNDIDHNDIDANDFMFI